MRLGGGVDVYEMLDKSTVNLRVQVTIMQVTFGQHSLSRWPQVLENSFAMNFCLQVTSHIGEQ